MLTYWSRGLYEFLSTNLVAASYMIKHVVLVCGARRSSPGDYILIYEPQLSCPTHVPLEPVATNLVAQRDYRCPARLQPAVSFFLRLYISHFCAVMSTELPSRLIHARTLCVRKVGGMLGTQSNRERRLANVCLHSNANRVHDIFDQLLRKA